MTSSTVSLEDVDFDRRGGGAERDELWRYVNTLVGESFPFWQKKGVLSNGGSDAPRDGFGVVVKVVDKLLGDVSVDFDNPYALFDLAIVSGSSRRFVYRAVCKQRAAVRTNRNTAVISEGNFRNPVTDADMDGANPQLGEYPHRGGVVVENDRYRVYAATSGFTGPQDHIASTFVGYMVLDRLTVQDAAGTNKSEESAANAEV